MRLAPSACSRRQIAAPTRLAPPVISTTFPCTSALRVRLLRVNLAQRPRRRTAPPTAPSPAGLMAELPLPDIDARVHSSRVVAHIRAAIAAAGGWIPSARYMELALYAPGLGYYAAGAAKLGVTGDFVTAPEISPLFGAALAVELRAI